MKQFKKIFSIILVCCMIMPMFASFVTAAEASGTCGNNLTWTLDSDGTLTISGTGDMRDYKGYADQSWTDYRYSIRKVIIEHGVTSIGKNAFCSVALESITIPESVTNIDLGAFYNCWYLSSVIIPDSVTNIGNLAFGACASLESAVISSGVSYISQEMFSGCKKLKNVFIPNSVSTIKYGAFEKCQELTTIYFSGTEEEWNLINTYDSSSSLLNATVFFNVDKKTLVDEDNLTWSYSEGTLTINGTGSMKNYDFVSPPWSDYSYNTEQIIIEPGVTSIGNNAFNGFASLNTIIIPDSITTIGTDAFNGCKSLLATYYSGTEDEWCSISLGDGNSQYVGVAPFFNSNPEEIYAEDNLSWNFENDTLTISGTGSMRNYDFVSPPWSDYSFDIKQIIIEPGVTSVGSNAFKGCSRVRSVTIPDSVTSIGTYAFYGCLNLNNITIPDGVTVIGSYAFGNISTISSVEIPSSVKYISKYAFYFCSNLSTVSISEGVENIGPYAFDSCYNLRNVYYEGSAKGWVSITVGEYNDKLLNARVYFANNSGDLEDSNLYSPSNDISRAKVSEIKDEINISADNCQTPTIALDGKQLVLGTDYVIWYSNTCTAGIAKMLIIGIGEYTGYIEKEYEITDADQYDITIGQSVSIRGDIPVKIAIGDSFDKVKIFYDGVEQKVLDKDSAVTFFKNYYSYTPKSNDSDSIANWRIVKYKTETEYEYKWNGNNYVMVKTTKDIELAATSITTYYSPVTEFSWAETQPIVQKNKIFIQPSIYPQFSYNQELVWTSSDESVAMVDSFGVVTVIKPGTVVITATTPNRHSITQELTIDAMDITKISTVTCTQNGTNEYNFNLIDKYGSLLEGVDYEVSYKTTNNVICATFNGIGLYNNTLTKYFDIVNDSSELPAHDHTYSDEWTIDREATITTPGEKSRHCTRCDSRTDVTEIPKVVESDKMFTDVHSDSWFKPYVDFVVSRGLMKGTSNTLFDPEATMTRAMVVTVLWRMEGEPSVNGSVPFTDVPENEWYAAPVAWAYQNGIVLGTTGTTFSPDGEITREQLATILYRYVGEYKGLDVSASGNIGGFPDAGEANDWAENALKWALGEGLITGSKEGGVTLLDPSGDATRAQVATILTRFCEKFE